MIFIDKHLHIVQLMLPIYSGDVVELVDTPVLEAGSSE